MTWKEQAIEQIDAILEWVFKVDKWDKLANRLSKLLLGKWNETQKAAIDNALELLNSGTVTKESIKDVLASLERSLGTNLGEAMREPVATVQTDSYHLAGKEIGINAEFNRADRKALDWLQRDAVYWIGNNYERTLSRQMQDAASEVIRQGMGRLEATAHLKQLFGEKFQRMDAYWEGLSNHIVTRSREFGRVAAYDKAGVKFFKVVAYLDHRTSRMCRAMNGRIISVDVARAQRDAMMNAKTPEDAKKIAPWYNDAQVESKVEGKPSGKLPKAVGLPPYHFNCRTRTVIAEEGEKEVLDGDDKYLRGSAVDNPGANETADLPWFTLPKFSGKNEENQFRAKIIEELRKDISEEINFGSIPTDQIVRIANTLKKYFIEFNIKKLDRIYSSGLQRGNFAEASGYQLGLSSKNYFSENAWKKIFDEDVRNWEKDNRKELEKFTKLYNVSPTVGILTDIQKFNDRLKYNRRLVIIEGKEIESTIIHEIGHIVFGQAREPVKSGFNIDRSVEWRWLVNEWTSIYAELKNTGEISKISKYATDKGSEEGFSECLVMYYYEKNNLPERARVAIEKMIQFRKGMING